MDDRLATVEPDGRMELSDRRHELGWLPLDGGVVVLRILDRGCVHMEMLGALAARNGMTEDEGRDAVLSWERTELAPPDLSGVCIASALRKTSPATGKVPRGRRSYRILIGRGLLSEAGRLVADVIQKSLPLPDMAKIRPSMLLPIYHPCRFLVH